MRRTCELVNDQIYHVMSKSIAGFVIFNSEFDYQRFLKTMRFFSYQNLPCKFAHFDAREGVKAQGFDSEFQELARGEKRRVDIIAYCIMPTHIHIVARQTADHGLSLFMGHLLNSYSRYFNTKYHRKGPLWQSKFKNVLVESTEQLLHLTRYIHLNPTSAGLTKKPADWQYSSYQEYLGESQPVKNCCVLGDLAPLVEKDYPKFVSEYQEDQRTLAILKKHLD